MSNFLFFDTETNDATPDRVAIQLAWILTSDNGDEMNYGNYILNRDVAISPMAESKHGISEIDMIEEGRDPYETYVKFLADIERADYIVAHNVAFDMKTVENDLELLGLSCSFESKTIICTMEQTRNIVQAKDRNGHIKNPRLEEMAGFLLHNDINYEFIGLHDAMEDTRLLKDCFFKLKELISSGQISKPQNSRPQSEKRKAQISQYFKAARTEAPSVMPVMMDKSELSSYDITSIFDSKNVLITGDLDNIGINSREEGASILVKMKAIVCKTIIKDIDFVIIGENCGPKKMEDLVKKQEKGHKVKCMSAEIFDYIRKNADSFN